MRLAGAEEIAICSHTNVRNVDTYLTKTTVLVVTDLAEVTIRHSLAGQTFQSTISHTPIVSDHSRS